MSDSKNELLYYGKIFTNICKKDWNTQEGILLYIIEREIPQINMLFPDILRASLSSLNINNMVFLLTSKYKKHILPYISDYEWDSISEYGNITDDFIIEFSDNLDWVHLSVHQDLSDNIIRKFKNKVEWILICMYKKMSISFIKEFSDKIEWEYSLDNKVITESTRKYICSFISENEIHVIS